MPPKLEKRFSIGIDRNCSEEIIVTAYNCREAKKKGWNIFANKKPIKKDHQIFCDEV